jgi:glycosyltransferase involved in cell wall biosynthesis
MHLIGEPLISVIVPAFGRQAFLREAVESVLSQTIDNLEVIIVDDCSPELLRRPVEDSRVRLVRREHNGGQSAAINTGLEHATGRYVAFLDDDDLYRSDRLALAIEGLKRAPVSLCWSSYIGSTIKKGRMLEGNVYDLILDDITPSLGSAVLERARCPMLDTSYVASADIEWWLRASRALEVTTVPQVAHFVRRHSGVRKLNGKQERIRSAQRLITQYDEYFLNHPKARSFRLFRMGVMNLRVGNQKEAARCLRKSFVMQPSARTAAHYLRSQSTFWTQKIFGCF